MSISSVYFGIALVYLGKAIFSKDAFDRRCDLMVALAYAVGGLMLGHFHIASGNTNDPIVLLA